MVRLAASKVRENFADILNRVAYQRERVLLRRRGRDLAALVSVDDLALLNKLEERLDVEAAQKALKEKGTIPWEKLKKQLGL